MCPVPRFASFAEFSIKQTVTLKFQCNTRDSRQPTPVHQPPVDYCTVLSNRNWQSAHCDLNPRLRLPNSGARRAAQSPILGAMIRVGTESYTIVGVALGLHYRCIKIAFTHRVYYSVQRIVAVSVCIQRIVPTIGFPYCNSTLNT